MSIKDRSNIPSVICALMASLTTGGTTYAFGFYGNTLKKTLDLTQGQIGAISTSFFCAGLFSWIPGLCADKLGTKFSIALGGCLGAASLLEFWAVSRQFVIIERQLLVPLLSVLSVMIFLSNAMVTGSVFKIIAATCGHGSKGSVVGIAKGYVGLGAAMYGGLFESLRQKNQSDLDFIPMAAFFAIVCAVIPAVTVLPTKQQVDSTSFQDNLTPLHFRILFCSLITMAILVAGSSLLSLFQQNVDAYDGNDELDDLGPNYGMFFVLVTVWLAPIIALRYIPTSATNEGVELTILDDMDEEEHDEEGNFRATTSLTELKVTREMDAEGEEHDTLLRTDDQVDLNGEVTRKPLLGEDMNLYQMLQTPTALLMLWTTTILVGSGTVETNNMGEMVEALGLAKSVGPASMTLFSVAQCASRVLTGVISESALQWNVRGFGMDKGIPRPMFLVFASILGFTAHLTLGFARNKFFFVLGAALSGGAFGMVWPMLVLVTGELFGTGNVGANYMFFDGFTSATGTLLLSQVVAQRVYEKHIDAKSEDTTTCIGMACFRQTHLIIAALIVSCMATSLATVYASRHVYNKRLHSP
ncbi:hypothetical protein FisN_1Lh492 [Fistulifera solaris]|uniref:Nodulin-like domain-containing protein n=1 Tax=Fistulifera solaris TaxID=1519565 RepID=A0A1Z5K1A8_FISSO|nr:hypothetical protein FisN_1Lh492 [Fistulifera solaris]|eukprot:GAX20027.1 hypothetical protein FisN_1Lh492 [Fistulifera solaris]